MIVNGWTQEIERLKAENKRLTDNRREKVMDILFMFVGVPAYAVSLWIILEYFNR
jgi:hypothetical protein